MSLSDGNQPESEAGAILHVTIIQKMGIGVQKVQLWILPGLGHLLNFSEIQFFLFASHMSVMSHFP